jgi:hypothetical protein
MLDYAANGLAYWSIERIQRAALETARRRGLDLDALLLELLSGAPEEQVSNFWDKVHTNLREQRVRLIFVVDEAPRELRRLVEFLNQKLTDVDVLIVEIKQYQGEGLTALAPRVLGITEATRAQKAATTPRKPNMTLAEYMRDATPAQQQVAHYIWRQAEERGFLITWSATAFAVRALDPRTKERRSFIYGYPTHFNFYFEVLPLAASEAAIWRQELLSTNLFRQSGKHTLEGVEVTEQNKTKVIALMGSIIDRIHTLFVSLADSGADVLVQTM